MRFIAALLFCLFQALAAKAEILIGVAGPLSGQNLVYGNELRSGVSAAVAAVNAAGGINGELLSIVEGDDGCDAKRAVEVSKSFVSQDVRVVVGHFCSSASLAAAPAYSAAGILMLNPAVTAPELTSRNFWNVFRLTGRDDAQADVTAARIKADGRASDVFVITDGQADTAGLTKRFLTALPGAKTIAVKAGNANLPDDPGLIVASAIYLALQASDAAVVAKEIKTLNINVSLYGPDYLQSETYGTRAEAAANGTLVTFLRDSITIADTSRAAAMATTEGVSLNAYAAVEAFVAAAKARNVNEARAMASWLSSGNEISTIIGPLRFTATGDLQAQPYVWYRWQDGTLLPE